MSEISDIFAKAPIDITDEDLAKIIAAQREQRAAYALAGKGQKAPGVKKAKAETGPVNLDLLDI